MKILIIGPPRTGTTSLCRYLGKTLDYDIFSELYNYDIRYRKGKDIPKYPFDLPEKCVVKSITFQTPKEFGEPFMYTNFINQYKTQFNHIILLSRRNIQEHLESFINLKYKLKKGVNAHEPWNFQDLKNFEHDISYEKNLKPHIDIIYKLEKILNVPITYYEDLYGNDRNKSLSIIKSWKIELDNKKLNEYLNPKFKYRYSKKVI